MAKRRDTASGPVTTQVEHSARGFPIRGYRVDVVEGPDAGAYRESHGERCAVGTHASCDLTLTDPTVSRFHCELTGDAHGVEIRDLGSRNSTLVDGVLVRDGAVKHGSLLRLGRSKLRVRFLGKTRRRLELSERQRFGTLVGHSVAMRSMFALLEKVAGSDTTILLQGETGTGKSAAAHSIHLESPRRDNPFIIVDCSSLPHNLLESELFGHEKGAFTGAQNRRIGAFEDADSGTVFLDEVGDMPMALQSKLLTVLENRAIRRLGANRSAPIDVRIIAATNRDLRSAVNEGQFREDLYYRLAVVDIELPPLRRRLDDLPLLVDSLLDRLRVSRERKAEIDMQELLAPLRRSAWPGNVRQLRNCLEQYLLFEYMEFDGLHLDDAPTPGQDSSVEGSADDAVVRIAVDSTVPLSEARQRVLAEFERIYLMRLLREHDGKVSRAAAAAEVNRTYLYRLMQRHDIDRDGT